MKFTVIGASGFIGSHLVSFLKSKQYDVFTPKKGEKTIFSQPLGRVIYCAGMTADFNKNPYETGRAHFCLLLDILEKADFETLVYLSSTRLYDGLTGVVNEQTNLILNSQNRRHLYDLTKAAGEALCISHEKAKIVRLGVVYDRQFNADIFPAYVLKEADANHSIELNSSEFISRDYILLDDVICLLEKITLTGKERLYNLASGRNIYNYEWAKIIKNSKQCDLIFLNNKSVPESPIIDISLIQQEFGFEPKHFLEILETV